jgi:hypothetical protein
MDKELLDNSGSATVSRTTSNNQLNKLEKSPFIKEADSNEEKESSQNSIMAEEPLLTAS